MNFNPERAQAGEASVARSINIEEQKLIYKESKKSYADLVRHPLDGMPNSEQILLLARSVVAAKGLLEAHGVNIAELDAEIAKESSDSE